MRHLPYPYCGRQGERRFTRREDDELDRLAEIFDADDSSRLACQILTGPQTDGLAVRLASDSLQECQP